MEICRPGWLTGTVLLAPGRRCMLGRRGRARGAGRGGCAVAAPPRGLTLPRGGGAALLARRPPGAVQRRGAESARPSPGAAPPA